VTWVDVTQIALCVGSLGRSVSHRGGETPGAELDTGTVGVQ
jgi:hypothetical protein